MGSVLVHTGQEPVSLSDREVQCLLERGDGDAALLFLALLRRRGTVQPRALAGELRWDKQRIEAAEETLRQLHLLVAQTQDLPEPPQERLNYQTADIVQRLEDSAAFRGLTSEVEKRLGRRLATSEVAILLNLHDGLGLPADIIYLLVGHCMERSARRYGPGRLPTLRQIETEGYVWVKMGIDTQAAAEAYLKRYAQQQESQPRYLAALGIEGRAAIASEQAYLTAWQEMGFPPETVAIAYEKTVMKHQKFYWGYCNGILKRWHAAGLHAPEEVRSEHRPTQSRKIPDRKDAAWKYAQKAFAPNGRRE